MELVDGRLLRGSFICAGRCQATEGPSLLDVFEHGGKSTNKTTTTVRAVGFEHIVFILDASMKIKHPSRMSHDGYQESPPRASRDQSWDQCPSPTPTEFTYNVDLPYTAEQLTNVAMTFPIRQYYRAIRTKPNIHAQSVVSRYGLTCEEVAMYIIRRNHASRRQKYTTVPPQRTY